jgi:c-di-AMP phosphodiesterase-like protein
MKDLRRRQFFNFLADFFEKIDSGHLRNKPKELLTFTEEEKMEWTKKFFKKYYMENAVLKDEVQRLKVDTNMSQKKRMCSCTVGMID